LPPRPRGSPTGRERGSDGPRSRFVYWHRELPPVDSEMLDEHIDSRRDDLTSESWLQGRFNYVLYRRRDQP